MPLIVQSFVASVIVINGWDDHYMLREINDDVRFYGWLAVNYTLIAMPLGMLFCILILGFKHNRGVYQNYLKSSVVSFISEKDSFIKLILYFLSIASLVSVCYTFYIIGEIPIFRVFSNSDLQDLSLLRQEAHRNFDGNVYIRNIFALTFTPILSYIAFSYWRLTSRNSDFCWFFILFIFSCFIVTYNLAKAPIIHYFLGFIFLKILMDGGIRKRYIFILFSLFFALLVGMYGLMGARLDFSYLFSINSGIGGRLFLSQASGTYLAFQYFPAQHGFLGLSSLSNILSMIVDAENSARSARIVMSIFRPGALENGTGGVINSLFIGEAWANFGIWGVLFAPLYIGFFIQAIFMFFLTHKKTPVLLGIFAYLSYDLPVAGGFNDFIYNPILVLIIVIFTVVYTISQMMKATKKRFFRNSRNNIF